VNGFVRGLALVVAGMLTADLDAVTYSIVDLGGVGGVRSSGAGMNNRGEVVGTILSEDKRLYPFVFGAQGMRLLGMPEGARGEAYAINDMGTVVGMVYSEDGRLQHLSFWRNGVWQGLDVRDFDVSSLVPYAINQDETVVGQVGFRVGGGEKGFVLKSGAFAALPTLGGVVSIAYGINDLGQIVGAATTPGDAQLRPAMWSNGMIADLGNLGGRLAAAHAINERGQVVGDSLTTGNVSRHAFFYENGVMRDLDPDPASASYLSSINANGDAVGPSHEYRNGRLAPFDALVNPYAFWSFYAVAINDSGLMLANGCKNKIHCRALLLVPLKPPPPPPAGQVNVIEFHHAASNHFFMTTQQAEIDALDSGAMPGWQRTGEFFRAYPAQVPGTSAVCRFYIPPGFGDSHFFSASLAECAETRAKFPHLVPETAEAFFIAVPDAAGRCAAGMVPLYRLWSQRADSNHATRSTPTCGTTWSMPAGLWKAMVPISPACARRRDAIRSSGRAPSRTDRASHA